VCLYIYTRKQNKKLDVKRYVLRERFSAPSGDLDCDYCCALPSYWPGLRSVAQNRSDDGGTLVVPVDSGSGATDDQGLVRVEFDGSALAARHYAHQSVMHRPKLLLPTPRGQISNGDYHSPILPPASFRVCASPLNTRPDNSGRVFNPRHHKGVFKGSKARSNTERIRQAKASMSLWYCLRQELICSCLGCRYLRLSMPSGAKKGSSRRFCRLHDFWEFLMLQEAALGKQKGRDSPSQSQSKCKRTPKRSKFLPASGEADCSGYIRN